MHATASHHDRPKFDASYSTHLKGPKSTFLVGRVLILSLSLSFLSEWHVTPGITVITLPPVM